MRSLGVSTADVRLTAAAAVREYRKARLPLEEVLEIADRLWRRGVLEERILAVTIVKRFRRHLRPAHWKLFDGWVGSLSNWAETDALCTDVLDTLIEKQPKLIARLKEWTRSRDRWRRRAAAVALVRRARRGEHHDAAFEICDQLAEVRDDMVEKGIGWLLKEASRTKPRAVADYLLNNIDRLSRTTVRYACEKLPERLRKRVMRAPYAPQRARR